MARVMAFFEAHRRLVVGCFLGALLLVGILAFKDYGIAWDEPVQRQYGSEVYGFVAHHDQALFLNRHRYYGPVFELTLYSLEKALGLDDTRPIYMMRHLVNFLALWVGAFFFYLLGRYVFRNWKVGLLGSIFLVLSPRVFAHAFYNTKDIPFLSMFIVGIYTMFRYLDAKTLRRAILHGVVCGILIDIRIVGIMLPALTVGLWAVDALRRGGAARNGRRAEWSAGARRAAASLVAYGFAGAGTTLLLWPTLWRDPIRSFVRIFEGMRNFPWEAPVLYLGQQVWSTRVPWHYTPVWIGVSTPPAYILLFGVGVVACLLCLRSPTHSSLLPLPRRDAGAILVWFLLPLVYFVASRAVLYDEWRHSLFIYPALLLIALAGLVTLWRLVRRRLHGRLGQAAAVALILLVALSLGSTTAFMIQHHPFQNVYFNSLVGGVKGASGKFELDYWGLSYRQGLEHIARSDRSPEISVFAATAPGRYNADILPPADRRRIAFVDEMYKADYYITNFRWERTHIPPEQEVYSVSVSGAKILAVFRTGR